MAKGNRKYTVVLDMDTGTTVTVASTVESEIALALVRSLLAIERPNFSAVAVEVGVDLAPPPF